MAVQERTRLEYRFPTQTPPSPLSAIRKEFLQELLPLSEYHLVHSDLVKRLGRRLSQEESLNHLLGWAKGFDGCRSIDPIVEVNRKMLEETLEHRLKNVRQGWSEEELEAVLGIKPCSAVPMLTGFSLLRVSPHYEEIYYADIHSDIVPDEVIKFIKHSVSVPHIGNDGWAGSVGRAIRSPQGQLHVWSSFRDDQGVVACEDLVGGNLSILMRCVYRDGVPKSSDTVAVVFCFFPLPGVFEEENDNKIDPPILQVFARAVDTHDYAIRTWIHMLDQEKSHEALGQLLAMREAQNSRKSILKTVVPAESQNNPVGSAAGIYWECKTSGEMVPVALHISHAYLERQLKRKLGDESIQDRLRQFLRYELSIRADPWGRIVFRSTEEMERDVDIKLPEEMLRVLGDLESYVERLGYGQDQFTRVHSLAHARKERIRELANDLQCALMGQIVEYLHCAQTHEADRKSFLRNIRHIVLVAYSFQYPHSLVYPKISSEGSLPETLPLLFGELSKLSKALESWASSVLSIVERSWCIYAEELPGTGESVVPAENVARSPVRTLRINEKKLEGILDGWLLEASAYLTVGKITDFASRMHAGLGDHALAAPFLALGLDGGAYFTNGTLSNGDRTSGYIVLLSRAPLVGDDAPVQPLASDGTHPTPVRWQSESRNLLLNLATATYSLTLTQTRAQLATIGQGAAHTLKNALAGIGILLGNAPLEARKALRSAILDPGLDSQLQEALQAATAVQRDLTLLTDQAELFLWMMDPDRADRIGNVEATEVSRRTLEELLIDSLLRGLDLAARRISAGELALSLFPSLRSCNSTTVKLKRNEFLDTLSASRRICADELLGTPRDAIQHFRSYLSETHFTLTWPEALPHGWIKGLDARIVAAVLVELFQNAAKAAILTQDPYLLLEVKMQAHRAVINIENSSSADRIQIVEKAFLMNRGQGVVGSHQFDGLWQLMLLCRELPGHSVTLDNPTIGVDWIRMHTEVGLVLKD